MTAAEKLGMRIRALRIEKKLDVEPLTKRLHVTTGWFYKLERGVAGGRSRSSGVSVDKLAHIATLLGVDLMDLFCHPEANIRHELVDVTRDASAEALREIKQFAVFKKSVEGSAGVDTPSRQPLRATGR